MILDNEPRKYILKDEVGKEGATEFMLKAITGRVANQLTNLIKLSKLGVAEYPIGDVKRVTLENCIVGWVNLKNVRGEEVAFNKDIILELPPSALNELYDEVNNISGAKNEEIKN